ncbi:MAG: FG-GAP repeat protein, partial [Planctomycetota bacterium]
MRGQWDKTTMTASPRWRRGGAAAAFVASLILLGASAQVRAAPREQEKLLASDRAAGDSFGYSVSVSGDVAVVGAHLDDHNGTDSGSAYVYRWDGSSWAQEQKLLASDGAAADSFAYCVS